MKLIYIKSIVTNYINIVSANFNAWFYSKTRIFVDVFMLPDNTETM